MGGDQTADTKDGAPLVDGRGNVQLQKRRGGGGEQRDHGHVGRSASSGRTRKWCSFQKRTLNPSHFSHRSTAVIGPQQSSLHSSHRSTAVIGPQQSSVHSSHRSTAVIGPQ
ncbi:hypothetical protein NHX12_025379 [Muraenolepis orangiensis]|uniref:Uncharacterized protein n=1 Tax=Muraenolepis orangiensis TaxID=630683 RepID=A0A9Q0EMP4_9TELE|nr:hypothetical protein NHX12_025379 [Muraenolepis orangiensis]